MHTRHRLSHNRTTRALILPHTLPQLAASGRSAASSRSTASRSDSASISREKGGPTSADRIGAPLQQQATVGNPQGRHNRKLQETSLTNDRSPAGLGAVHHLCKFAPAAVRRRLDQEQAVGLCRPPRLGEPDHNLRAKGKVGGKEE